ncbi:DNA-binding transcriptional activator GcvA [compost metagenome]
MDAAEQGLGVALVPRPLVESALSNGTLVLAVGEPCQLDSGTGFHVLTGAPAAQCSALEKVIDWLSSEAQVTAADTH